MADQIMAESKPQKPGLLRRILWWLWVLLLSILLAIGIFFAAPWKAITLIAIFLAAATILPRIYHKWFWLGVGIVVLATIAWIFLPDDNKDWQPYTFDKELAQLQAKYAVSDSENAAIIYKQILAEWKQKEANEPNLPDTCGWFSLVGHGPWFIKDQPEIAAYIQYHRDTIEQLACARKFDRCAFPINANISDFGKDIDRLAPARQWVYLLVAAGNNDMAEGYINEALEKYFTVHRIGQHFCQQPRIVDMLVGIAIETLGLSSINNFVILGDANEHNLSKIEKAVLDIRYDWSSDLPGFIDIEKLMLKNMMGCLFYEINSKGKVRFSHDPLATIKEWTKEQSDGVTVDDAEIFSGYWFKKLFKAYTILYWFYAPHTPEKLSLIVNDCFEKNDTMTEPDFDWSKEPKNVPMESIFQYKMNFRKHVMLLARMNMESYFGLHDTYLRNSAGQRGALLIIALRRYKNSNGQWPEKLEDIKNSVPAEFFIDPINGGSFVYKLTEDNFTLYSKGKNELDEGGELETKFSDDYRKIEKIKDDEMIWSPKSHEDEKQNDNGKQ